MSTRITQSMVTTRVLTDLQNVSSQLSQTQEKLSSGKELTKPSDDPFATSKALSLSNQLQGTQQYERTTDDATAWANITETSLASINNAAQRARTLLVQAGTATGTAPYVLGGPPPNDAYQGNTNGVFRTIGPNVSVQINTTASSLLGSGVAGDNGLISILRGISQHLRSGTATDADALR